MILLFILFFLPLLLFLHSYIFYPLSIWTISKFNDKKYSNDDNYLPEISILISAYNEERVIENTIRTLMNCFYPKERLQIIIGSDNSEDRTAEILEKLSEPIIICSLSLG